MPARNRDTVSVFKNLCVGSCDVVYNLLVFTFKVTWVYILWILLHFASAHLYTRFCAENTLVGLIISPFMTAAPHCQGMRWIIYTSANVINSMWLVMGAWIASKIFSLGNNQVRE